MRGNKDWSTLDIGETWEWDVVLFESNCIILVHNTSVKTKNILFNP